MTRFFTALLVALCVMTVVLSSALPQLPVSAGVRFLTRDAGAIDYWPCFSPDGNAVLFSRTVDQRRTWQLVAVPTQGGAVRSFPASPLPVSATRASWARSGFVAFTGTLLDGKNTVWVIGGDGTGARQVSVSALTDQVLYPSWYPDGETLAVVDAGEAVIKRFTVRGDRSATAVTDHRQVLTGMPSVSPDGRWVAFAGQRNDGQRYDQSKNSIWVVGKDGVARTVEAVPAQGRTPAWSPDGQRLAFESNRGSASDLYAVFIINSDGSGLRRVTEYDLSANHPVWSPDGRKLVFSARHTLGREATGIAIVDVPSP